MAATYAIKPGDSLTRQYPFSLFADAGYAIEVHGPNGFYRSFTGRADSRPYRGADLLRAERHGSDGECAGASAQPSRSSLSASRSETMRTRQSLSPKNRTRPGNIGCSGLSNKVTAGMTTRSRQAGSDAEARFAGRVETGRASFSDPFMGGIV